jgi:hypothetical protein
MSVLYNENVITSSRDIAAIPKTNFVAAYADKLGSKVLAGSTHERASYITRRIDQLYITMNDTLNGITPAYLKLKGGNGEATLALDKANANDPVPEGATSPGGGIQEVVKKYFPNWENLFGSINNCECEECRSITSPAAYLVDMLQFLEKIPIENSKTVLDSLFYRRPDLGELPLTCENTKTVIPYIDLVNEIMEYYVVNGEPGNYKGHDTGDTTTEELHANPQNTDKEAYRILSNNSVPGHGDLSAIHAGFVMEEWTGGTHRSHEIQSLRHGEAGIPVSPASITTQFWIGHRLDTIFG